jgi:SsrA-binding protein
VKDGEVWLVNANVPEFSHGNRFNHEPKRPRKLPSTAARSRNYLARSPARDDVGPAFHIFQFTGPGESRAGPGAGPQAHDKRDYEK